MTLRLSPWLALGLALFISSEASAQRGRANVLYSDNPLPLRIGVEVGSGFSSWQHASPTLFPVSYAYSNPGDTIHVRFPGGAEGLWGTHLAIALDIGIARDWSILAKLGYNERRGRWESQSSTLCEDGTTLTAIPVQNKLTLMLRYLTAEAYFKYSIEQLGGLYLGGDIALSFLLSNHYDLSQSIEGDEGCSFIDFRTGQPTGITSYAVGREFEKELRGLVPELKFLLGYPIPISTRWSLNPEVSFAYPLISVWSSEGQDALSTGGVSEAPNPITLTAILALRYEF